MNKNSHKIIEDFLYDIYNGFGKEQESTISTYLDKITLAKKVSLLKKIILFISILMIVKLLFSLVFSFYDLLIYDFSVLLLMGGIFYFLSEKTFNNILYLMLISSYPILLYSLFINGMHYSLIPCMIAVYGILNYLATTFKFQLTNAIVAFLFTLLVLVLNQIYTFEEGNWIFDMVVLASSFGGLIYTLYFYQKEIRENKEKIITNNLFFKEITDMNPDSIFVKDTKHKYVFVNQVMADNYGVSKAEMLGKSREEILINSQRNKEISEQDDLVLKHNQVYLGIEEFIEEDGAKQYLKVVKSPVKSPNGEVKGILGVITDVSDRVNSDKALRERELIFRALLDNVYDGVEIYKILEDGSVTLIERNQKMRDVLGRTDEEISAKNAIINHSPAYQSNGEKSKDFFDNLAEQYKGSDFLDFEWDIYHSKGHLLTLNISRFKMTIGKLTYSIGIYKDITEKKRTAIALKESEIRYRSIFEHNAFGVVVAREGKFYDFNQAFCRMTGYNEEEIKGRKIDEIMHPIDYTNTLPIVDGIINKKTANLGFEHRFVRKNGSIGYAFVQFMEIDSSIENGEMVATIADISSLKEADLRLKEKNEELKKYIKSNSALESFAYVASHDLKEPIRSIVSFSQILAENADDRLLDEEKEYLDFIISSSLNMKRLIEDLLAYSRVNPYNLKFEAIDVNDLIFSIERDLMMVINEKKAKLISKNLPVNLIADQTQMRQLFQNLIANALKFDIPNITPEVIVSVEEQEEQWLFSVRDNGIGIDPKHFDRIFLLFRRLHTKNEYDGTGIGLAMCKKIVENHHGEIWIESEKGKGATFFFTLSKSLVPDQQKSPQLSSI